MTDTLSHDSTAPGFYIVLEVDTRTGWREAWRFGAYPTERDAVIAMLEMRSRHALRPVEWMKVIEVKENNR